MWCARFSSYLLQLVPWCRNCWPMHSHPFAYSQSVSQSTSLCLYKIHQLIHIFSICEPLPFPRELTVVPDATFSPVTSSWWPFNPSSEEFTFLVCNKCFLVLQSYSQQWWYNVISDELKPGRYLMNVGSVGLFLPVLRYTFRQEMTPPSHIRQPANLKFSEPQCT